MNVLETIETFKDGLMWIGLGALLLIAAVCACVGLRRVSRALYARLCPAAIGVLAVAAIFATCEAQKRSGGTGTTGILPVATVANVQAVSTGGTPVVPVVQSPATGGTPVVPVVVTPEEIAQGWRLESVTTNDAVSYAMPTNGVEYAPWSQRGGYGTHFPLALGDDFGFPFGTGMVHRLDVLSGGMVESLPRQRAGCPLSQWESVISICAAREYASIVPGVSRFWWADTARSVIAPSYGNNCQVLIAKRSAPAIPLCFRVSSSSWQKCPRRLHQLLGSQ